MCYGADYDWVGKLSLTEGNILIDSDGEVRLSLRGVSGPTAIEPSPPYTLRAYFFTITRVNERPVPHGDGFELVTDAFSNYDGVLGVLPGPAIGFFTINSRGSDGTYDYFTGGRQQFISTSQR